MLKYALGYKHEFLQIKPKMWFLNIKTQYFFSELHKICKIPSQSVVEEFMYAFPKDLPWLPPKKDIEFVIDLLLGTKPILITSYWMVAIELRELKK